mgnify:CR=1 FL=1
MAYDSIIEYYDAGAPLSTSLTRDNARDYKERSKQYKRMLKEEYYDNENPRGVQSLYNILKANNPDDGEHPKRYALLWGTGSGGRGSTRSIGRRRGRPRASSPWW